MNRERVKPFIPILIVFIALNVFLIAAKALLVRMNMDQEVVLAGNALLFIITLASFLFSVRGLEHSNPNVFFRSVYSGIMVRLFVCIIAAFIYISINKVKLNKPGLFTCMGLYLVYTFLEVSVLMNLLKHKTNA